ncbi:TetR/AcrR family transcriptional regulator [Lysobacter sp. A286]
MATLGRPRTFDRQQALENAMHAFWRHGYESTSLAQLRSAMGGLSAASFYAAFGSKEALYRETVELYLSTDGSAVRIALEDASSSPREAIARALRSAARIQTAQEHPYGCMVVLSALNCSPANDHVRQSMTDERASTQALVHNCVLKATKLGALSRGIDAEALTLLVVTLLNGISIQARDGASLPELDGMIDLAMTMWDATAQSDSQRSLSSR